MPTLPAMTLHSNDRPRPLEDVTVLDLTMALAGPYATLLLAGLGARVIKVEDPANGDSCRTNPPYLGASGAKLTRDEQDDISISELNRLRNKLGIGLNLKHPRSAEIFADLVRKSDILVENFTKGTLDRLGAGYERARQINPRIVYCSITGFGSRGETSSARAMDAIIQALSGLMMTAGSESDPPARIGVPLADLTAPMFAVIGVLAALHQAKRTGAGQHVDVSMLGAMTSLVACEHFDVLEKCGVPTRTGQTTPRLAPFGVYKTSDSYIAICAHTDKLAHALLKAIEHGDLIGDVRFNTRDQRVRNSAALDAVIEGWSQAKTTLLALDRLEQMGVPAAEVRDPTRAVSDPRVLSRKETVALLHPKFGAVDAAYGTGLPIGFSESIVGFDRPPPALGEDNDAVYGGILGYSPELIDELRQSGVI